MTVGGEEGAGVGMLLGKRVGVGVGKVVGLPVQQPQLDPQVSDSQAVPPSSVHDALLDTQMPSCVDSQNTTASVGAQVHSLVVGAGVGQDEQQPQPEPQPSDKKLPLSALQLASEETHSPRDIKGKYDKGKANK